MPKLKRKILKIIEAHKIKLVDSSGKVRILLDAAGSQNTVSFHLFGTSGEGLTLCLDRDKNPKIILTDRQGNTCIAIGISNDLGPGLSLYNSKNELVGLVFVDTISQEMRVILPKKSRAKRK